VDVDLALATCMREGGTVMAEAFKGLRE
jgi:hypothetical protein